eukprot:TRINITY_DN37845_c0_g1_i2.p1 TRINITY_DN37845_c0_g1~~TRINITY_DN37845_c0_g1_i2.p1  ORF type:complete len:216 (-),score=30.52 TRINITY_DN37845_c0_g1_i2:73-720(-)
MSAHAMNAMPSTPATPLAKKPRFELRPRSRFLVLLASGAFAVLLFLIDSPAVGGGSWTAELCCYAGGLLAAAVCAQYAPSRNGSKSISKSPLVDLNEMLFALRRRVQAVATSIKARTVARYRAIREWRPWRADGPFFSRKVVEIVSIAMVTCLVPLLLLPFQADMSGEAQESNAMVFFDAPPKQCSPVDGQLRQGKKQTFEYLFCLMEQSEVLSV